MVKCDKKINKKYCIKISAWAYVRKINMDPIFYRRIIFKKIWGHTIEYGIY